MFEIDVKKNFEYCNKNDFSSVYRVKAEENSLSSMYMEEYKNELEHNQKGGGICAYRNHDLIACCLW